MRPLPPTGKLRHKRPRNTTSKRPRRRRVTRRNSSGCARWWPRRRTRSPRWRTRPRRRTRPCATSFGASRTCPMTTCPTGRTRPTMSRSPLGHAARVRLHAQGAFRARQALPPGMDFETAAKLSGSRFVVLSGAVARVHRALAQFMLDTHVDRERPDRGQRPRCWCATRRCTAPASCRSSARTATRPTNGWWLIPTAEVTLTNIVNGPYRGGGVPADALYVAHSQCFRSEAGRRARTPPACCASTSSRRSRWCRSPIPITADAEHDRMTALRRGDPRTARPALSHGGPVHRRHGLRRAAHP
jgi:hypothetical protein